MSETNSLQFPDQTTGPTHSADTKATKNSDLPGHVFFERIGVGGMGEVYRCADDALGRDLAIKVLRAELRGDAGAEERFLREARQVMDWGLAKQLSRTEPAPPPSEATQEVETVTRVEEAEGLSRAG